MPMYDNDDIVKASFNYHYISDYLIQAQWAEFVELKKVIAEIYEQMKVPISILDIGVGDGRIPRNLCHITEIWDKVTAYHGTDNAQACVDLSLQTAKALGIEDKFNVHLYEATDLVNWKLGHDLVICTWFTPGNFYPDGFNFNTYKAGSAVVNLECNDKFEIVFSAAYGLLKPGGELVLGACYIDNDSTRLKQEESYRKMGMEVITSAGESFTATRQGFWSQRFTREKLMQYLHFAAPGQISFTALDTYDYAMQVRVKKPV